MDSTAVKNTTQLISLLQVVMPALVTIVTAIIGYLGGRGHQTLITNSKANASTDKPN